MKLIYSKYLINNRIPVLEVKKENKENRKQSCILFFHGFTASSETHLKELENLAENGFTAIGIDNIGHGRRKYADFESRFSDSNPEKLNNIKTAIQDTAIEVPEIIDYLIKFKSTNPESIGIAGISMGAFITYRTLQLEKRLASASAILGAPEWEFSPKNNNLDNYIESLDNVKILSQNAESDEYVPPIGSITLHKKLKEKFGREYNKRYKYIEFPNSGHFMSEKDWTICWNNTINWFQKI